MNYFCALNKSAENEKLFSKPFGSLATTCSTFSDVSCVSFHRMMFVMQLNAATQKVKVVGEETRSAIQIIQQ